MKRIHLRELGAHLDKHLREAREDRETVTVLEDGEPMVRIVPCGSEESDLRIRGPFPGAPRLQDVPLPAPLALDVDVVAVLLEERQGSR